MLECEEEEKEEAEKRRGQQQLHKVSRHCSRRQLFPPRRASPAGVPRATLCRGNSGRRVFPSGASDTPAGDGRSSRQNIHEDLPPPPPL